MPRKKGNFRYFLILVLTLMISAWVVELASAQASDRQTTIVVSYTEYEWWLIRWADNHIVCKIISDHEGLPTGKEVLRSCGEDLYYEWISTPPCKKIAKGGSDTSTCSGYYFHLASLNNTTREVIIDLPSPIVWIDLKDCDALQDSNLCRTMPYLVLIGEEPLPNETIVAIEGTYAGEPFYCESDICNIPLRPTAPQGVVVEFWGLSSYGDKTDLYKAYVRVVDSGVTTTPGAGGWYVDVLSTQWLGGSTAVCAQTWEAFPPAGELPSWLQTPEHPEVLASDGAYFYLAGRLIAQGVVDASACPSGGLLPNGFADTCGLEKSSELIEVWQNQFDESLIDVAGETGVPAQLMKNLFAQESQFWPGMFRVRWEFGLGQLTANGAETILLWNPTFFDQFCPLVLSEDNCAKGYLGVTPENQAILRGALALQVNADCPDCLTGVDLTNVYFSMPLFANILRSNCDQVAQIIFNATGERAGAVSSYEDLWRYTIANYQAGPGCVSFAIHMGWRSAEGWLTWENVASNFTETCKGVVPYVNKITE